VVFPNRVDAGQLSTLSKFFEDVPGRYFLAGLLFKPFTGFGDFGVGKDRFAHQ
jgi:hypothetical protein